MVSTDQKKLSKIESELEERRQQFRKTQEELEDKRAEANRAQVISGFYYKALALVPDIGSELRGSRCRLTFIGLSCSYRYDNFNWNSWHIYHIYSQSAVQALDFSHDISVKG